MDTRKGTCASMPALHVAICWRLGWPVSLACVGPHYVCRYDDGEVVHNIEATDTGRGGVASEPDEDYMERLRLPPIAVSCGSDLRSLTSREMLGAFLGIRARYFVCNGQHKEAEPDVLFARWLFPENRYLFGLQMEQSMAYGFRLLEEGEVGHPFELARRFQQYAYTKAQQDRADCSMTRLDVGW
jgi:hypothetical protein